LVLFNVQSGLKNQVLNAVKKVEGVEEAYISFGVYDIAAKLRIDYMEDLKKVIQNKLRQIDGVRLTSSLVLVEE
jgi:DNA-binding Lrp family transcriptional regulator